MSEEINYEKLQFMCGIEIHQQFEGKKLFCNCPTTIRKDQPDFTIKRRLRASAGESGKTDAAAKYEQKKDKFFIYSGYNDSNCLLETDEEPPGKINEDALNAAIAFCKMVNAKIPKKVVFMRKTVIDGSNTSGFQRTALIGSDGIIKVNDKIIRIDSICLEEDACQVIKRGDEFDTYNLSRLGIPLIEIATAPDIRSPEECKEVAAKLGMLLRSTGKCKRGIGSIRQDVNVSINNGIRIEIKGFQDLKSIPKIINYEIKRQLKGDITKEETVSHVRKAEGDLTTTFLRPMPGADRMYPETDVPVIDIKFSKNIKIKTIEDREKEYENDYKLNSDYSKNIVSFEDKSQMNFKNIVEKFSKVDPTLIANILINIPKEIRRKEKIEFEILNFYEEVLGKLNNNLITISALEEIMLLKAKGKTVDYNKFKPLDESQIIKELKEILKINKGAPMGAIMGTCMKHFKGKVDGKKLSEMIRKEMS